MKIFEELTVNKLTFPLQAQAPYGRQSLPLRNAVQPVAP